MPQGETRKLAAIMLTDIVGFSCQMGSNEARTLRPSTSLRYAQAERGRFHLSVEGVPMSCILI